MITRMWWCLFSVNALALFGMCTQHIINVYSTQDIIISSVSSEFNLAAGQPEITEDDELDIDPFETDQLLAFEDHYINAEHKRASIESAAGRHQSAISILKQQLHAHPESAELLNDLGVYYMRLQQYDDATASLRQAIEVDPEHVKAWYNYGTALLAMERYSDAVSALRKTCALHPWHGSALFNLAVALSKSGDVAGAETIYRKICEINNASSSAAAWQNLGILAMRSNRLKEAASCFRSALYKKAGYIKARYNLAIALRKMDLPDQAREEYEKLLSLNPDHYKSLMNLSLLLMDADDISDALPLLQRAAQSEEASHSTFYRLALCYEANKQHPSALKALNDALKRNPAYEKAWYLRAQLARDEKQFDEAEESIARAIQLGGRQHKYIYLLASIQSDLNKDEQARELFKEAVALNGKHYLSWYNLALSAYRSEQFAEAAKGFEQACTLMPRSHRSWYMLGLSLYKQDFFNKAREAFEQSLRHQLDHRSLYNMGLCHEALQQATAAEACFRQALEIEPRHTPSMSHLAYLLYERMDFERSNKLCEKLQKVDPDNKTACYIARRHFKAGRDREGKKLLELALYGSGSVQQLAQSISKKHADDEPQQDEEHNSVEQDVTH